MKATHMNQESFITELSTVNQTVADIEVEIKHLYKSINCGCNIEIVKAARALACAARVLEISSKVISENCNDLIYS